MTEIIIFMSGTITLLPGLCRGQDCDYPTTDDLKGVIERVIPSEDMSTTPTVNVIELNLVCLAVSDERDLYRSVSVVVRYTCSGNVNCPSDTAEEQFESQCNAGSWSNNVFDFTVRTRSVTTNASLSTITKRDCAFCLSLELASRFSLITDDVHHCVACDWSCNKGHRRCFGLAPSVCSEPESSDSSCCNFYHDSVCVDECPRAYLSNSDNDCVCPVGTTGNNCEDVIRCERLENPGDGSVSSTDTTYNSTATYSCNSGYTLPAGDEMRTCSEDGTWSGSKPTCSACHVAECEMCDSNISMCDMCNNNRPFNTTSKECPTAVCTMSCEDAEKGATIAAIVLAVLNSLIITIIIIVVYCWYCPKNPNRTQTMPTSKDTPTQDKFTQTLSDEQIDEQ